MLTQVGAQRLVFCLGKSSTISGDLSGKLLAHMEALCISRVGGSSPVLVPRDL